MYQLRNKTQSMIFKKKIQDFFKPPGSDPRHGLKTSYMNLFLGLKKTIKGKIRFDFKYDRIGYHTLFPYEGIIPKNFRHELAIAAIIRNESRYLKEWIEFHLLMGCTKFYIYDNSSDDNTPSILDSYTKSGTVELMDWPHLTPWLNTQQLAYCHAIYKSRGNVRWIAFIDADEFLFSPTEKKLPLFLEAYNDLPALIIYWHMFGTSGHISPPDGLLIENYKKCLDVEHPQNAYKPLSKSIVQPHRIFAVSNPHYFQTDVWPILGFDENREPIVKVSDVHLQKQIRLNHYYTKSQKEWNERLSRSKTCIGSKPNQPRSPTLNAYKKTFNEIHKFEIIDTSIHFILPELKRRMSDPTIL
jgi:hypothetical protein